MHWNLRDAILALLAVQVAAVFWVVTAEAVANGIGLETDRIAFLPLGTAGLWLGYFLAPAAISRNKGRGPSVDFDIGIRPGEAAVALVAGIGMQTLVLPALYWPIARLTDTDPGERAQELVDRVDGPADVVILALSVVLVAPVVEERFYRGFLLPASVTAVGPTFGILGTSLLFGLVHQDLIQIPGLMVLAVVLAWMTASTGRIGPAVVTHMAFNATAVVRLLWPA